MHISPGLISLIPSMTVNPLATGLTVFRISKVLCKVKDITTLDEKSLGITREKKLCSVIFIIIESGMALLVIQLAWVTMLLLDEFDISLMNENPSGQNDAYSLIVPIHQMLNVITSLVMAISCFTNNMHLARV